MEMKQKTMKRARSRFPIAGTALAALLVISLVGFAPAGQAQIANTAQPLPHVVLPLIQCWYKGKVAYYIQTDASDQTLSQQMGLNYVSRLSNTISANAVDDIYHITNFTQGNVIPSAPIPAGPGNSDPNYTPLWQLSTVTWNPGITPHLLTSEEEVLDAQSQGLVTIVKTNIVINCPVIYTPAGGLLPTARIIGDSEQLNN